MKIAVLYEIPDSPIYCSDGDSGEKWVHSLISIKGMFYVGIY